MFSGRLTRRRPLVIALLAAVLALAACSGSPDGGTAMPTPPTLHPADPRPNIVFVLTDDLSTNLVPYMPHVQALMRTGTTFSNYFVVDSLCCPSRSAIFTGRYPHNDGVFRNTGDDGGYAAYNRFGNPKRSFAVALQAAGYRTGFMGKYLNGYDPSDPPPPGWDEWDGAGNAYWEFNYELNQNGHLQHYGHDPQDYLTDVLAARAREFVRTSAQSGRAFALEVATFAPHKPAEPAPRDNGLFPRLGVPRGPAFDRPVTGAPPWLADLKPLSAKAINNLDAGFRRRVESVQAVDRLIGQIQATLAEEHRLSNTYFVFSSDNGYHMGEYRMLAGKQTAFDTDIRVPLVVAGPGVPAGHTVTAMTSSIDLAPTFAQIAGTSLPETPDGVSLLDLLHGRPAPEDWQRAVLVEHHGPTTAAGDPDVQPPAAGDPPSYEAMRTRTALYVEYATGQREYYDLVNDPYELHSLADSLPKARLDQLHAQLQALAVCKGASACQRAAMLSQPRG